MFPPLAKLRWANLPKIGKKFVFILLLLGIFFVSSPLVYAQAAPQVITPQKGADGQDYLLIPVSDLEQNPNLNQYQNRRFATSSANPEGGQVLGIIGMFKDIWDELKEFGEGFAAIGGCLLDPAGCALGGMMSFIEFASTTFFKTVLNMVGGDATNCFLPGDRGDELNDQCQEVTAAVDAFQRGEPIAVDPSQFGLLGVAAQTTTTALAMPVPMDSTTYLASLNPFAEVRATAGTSELEGSKIVLNIWKKVRDGSYILLVVATVIIGFMIMLRIPTGPRTAVTVQNSLPKIAIALLLITFSFLIGGLMIDGTRIIGNLLQSFLPSISLAGSLEGIAAILGLVLVFLLTIFLIGTVIGGPIGFLVAIAVLLLIVFALVAMFVMIAYKLITRLVIFLLMVMFAPLFFLAGALPKGEAAIIFWFKRTAAALIAIPATGFVFSLALVIGTSGTGSFNLDFAANTGIFGVGSEGGFAGTLADMFSWAFAAPFIGLVLLSFAIKTPDIVDEMFGVKGFASRAGGLGAILGAPMAAAGAASGAARNWKYSRGLREGAGRIVQSAGWARGGERTSGTIPAGMSARSMSPQWSKTLQKAGVLQERGRVPPGLPASSLPDNYRNLLQQEGLIHTPPGATEPVTKAGTIVSTGEEGAVEGPAGVSSQRKGFKAAVARAVVRRTGPLIGTATPAETLSGRPTFKTAEQLREEDAKVEAAAKGSGGPGAGESTDEEKDRPV